jgi:ABC-type transport system involved in multi-copper enzyme maturation permease subunit
MRAGLGPVFVYEWLTASRRRQMYAVRAAFVGVLFAAVAVIWFSKVETDLRSAPPADRQAYARAGEALFYAFFGTLLTVTLLLAPGATAGAVCLDKARGTLLHLLVTDLSSTEIVFGKLAARLLPLFGLVLASVPVLSICLWLGGIDPDAMLVAYAVTAGVAVLGGSFTFLLSVWGRKTHEVLLAAYLLEVLLLLAYPIALGLDAIWKMTWLSPYLTWTNPFRLAFSPYLFRGPPDPDDLATFLGFCLGVGAVSALLAVLTVRRVTVRQASRPERARRRRWLRRPRWLGPRLDRNPVVWREWHRQRPSRWVRMVWAVYVGLAISATVAVYYHRNESGMAAVMSAFQVSIGLLLASVAAVTCLSEERARGSLDVLLATPLTTRSIVWGKWRGAFRLVPWLAVLPVINVALVTKPGNVPPWVTPAGMTPPSLPPPPEYPNLIWLCVPLMAALVLAYGATITSFGLLCATWIRRQGRAIAASVVAYALVTAGWMALVAVILQNRDAERFMIGSPFFGPGQLAAESGMTYHRTAAGLPEQFGATLTWAVGYAVFAGVVYLAALVTFNRCLGRAPERRMFMPPARGPAARARPRGPDRSRPGPSRTAGPTTGSDTPAPAG